MFVEYDETLADTYIQLTQIISPKVGKLESLPPSWKVSWSGTESDCQ
jgi:hypothetical protein